MQHTLRRIVLLAAALLVIPALPTSTALPAVAETHFDPAADANADTSWYTADATAFHLTTAAQLQGLAWLVYLGDDMAGKTIYLDEDIYLNDTTNCADWAGTPPTNHFAPIGEREDTPFAGTFDGQGNRIHGLYQHRQTVNHSAMPMFCGGLFGYLAAEGSIRNVECVDAYIQLDIFETTDEEQYYHTTTVYAGGICGLNAGGVISGCDFSGTVIAQPSSSPKMSSSGMCGGICGRVNAGGTVQDCSSSGEVTVRAYAAEVDDAKRIYAYVGGICGYLQESRVSGCVSRALVAAEGYYSAEAGGIVGTLWRCCALADCASLADVSAWRGQVDDTAYFSLAGGIAGSAGAKAEAHVSTLTNCYAIGNIHADALQEGSAWYGAICGGMGSIHEDVIYTPIFENCHYFVRDSGTEAFPVLGRAEGLSADDPHYQATAYTEPALCSTPTMAEALGEAFVFVEGTPPRLAWEAARIGDANGDRVCTIADAVSLQRWLLGEDAFVLRRPERVDYNADDRINALELTWLKQKLIAEEKETI